MKKNEKKDINIINGHKLPKFHKYISTNHHHHQSKQQQTIIKGHNFNQTNDISQVISSFQTTGFQATNLDQSIKIINEMIYERYKPSKGEGKGKGKELSPSEKCTIMLGFTSNMISCGVREIIRFLLEHKMVDCIVTTTGGIEEDIMKCLADTYLGKFTLRGNRLRTTGINRIGNLLVPNNNYIMFEDFIYDIFDDCLIDQRKKKVLWTPSRLIKKLGIEIDNEESVMYWAAKNDIPVYCPCVTDGSVGDMLYLHGFKNPGLMVDIVGDVRKINDQAVKAKKTGMIIIGGGMVKNHICNANFMRNGADYAVFINTADDYDGSNSGSLPEKDFIRHRIKENGKYVKINCEATLVFPLIVAKTFAKYHDEMKKKKKDEDEEIIVGPFLY